MSNHSILIDPRLGDGAEAIESAVRLKRLVTVVGECRVDYRDRASSTLGWGERLLMIKEDGAILVHRPRGCEPTNWQPPGCMLTIKLLEGEVEVRAVRRAPRELLSVVFRSFKMVASFKLQDLAEFEMYASEEDLYDIIRSDPEIIEPGLRIVSEQRGLGGGVADFTCRDSMGRYVVVEVKRRRADLEAVKQAYKYVAEMRRSRPDIRSILVAPGIGRGARRLAASLGVEFVQIDLRSIGRSLRARRVSSLDDAEADSKA